MRKTLNLIKEKFCKFYQWELKTFNKLLGIK